MIGRADRPAGISMRCVGLGFSDHQLPRFEVKIVTSCCTAISILLLCTKVSCIWHLVYVTSAQSASFTASIERTMSKTVALHLVPSSSLFARFVNTLDRVLMASARAAVRNGDVPYFGL